MRGLLDVPNFEAESCDLRFWVSGSNQLVASGKVSLVQLASVKNMMASNEYYNGTLESQSNDRTFKQQLEVLAIRYRGSAESLIAELCSVSSPFYYSCEKSIYKSCSSPSRVQIFIRQLWVTKGFNQRPTRRKLLRSLAACMTLHGKATQQSLSKHCRQVSHLI